MKFISFNGIEIDHNFISKNFIYENDIIAHTYQNKTILYGWRKILVLNSGKKIKLQLDLEKEFPEIVTDQNEYKEILKMDGSIIWFIYENHLIMYDINLKKTVKKVNLTEWQPHQSTLDQNNTVLWLVSLLDGQLYGIEI